MPLSKSKQAAYMREYRKRNRYNVIPKREDIVQPTVIPSVIPNFVIPWYNKAIHRPGDTVKMRDQSGRERVIVIPELDGDGQEVW